MFVDRRKFLSAAGLLAAVTVPAALAADSDPGAHEDQQKEKNLAIGEAEARRMLLLMDRDQNGKVSKQEFMAFMEAEFERLDKNKDGELDVKELTYTRVRVGGAIHR